MNPRQICISQWIPVQQENLGSHHLGEKAKTGAATLKDDLALNQSHIGIYLPYHPALPCLFTHELKSYIHTKTCMRIFMAVLFISAPKLEPTKVSFNRWMSEYNLAFSAACLSIRNMLICRYKHWHLNRCVFLVYISILNSHIWSLRCFAFFFFFKPQSPQVIGVSPPLREELTLSPCWQQGWGQCLELGEVVKSSFTLLQSLTPGEFLTQCLPLRYPWNTQSQGSESKMGRQQWASCPGACCTPNSAHVGRGAKCLSEVTPLTSGGLD